MLAGLYYKKKGILQGNEEKTIKKISTNGAQKGETVQSTKDSNSSSGRSTKYEKNFGETYPRRPYMQMEAVAKVCLDKTKEVSNALEMGSTPGAAQYSKKLIETSNVVRFSSRKSLRNSNRILSALNETIGEKYTSLSRIDSQFLRTKRNAFLETLFNTDDTMQTPPRFSIEKSRENLCGGVARMFGGNYCSTIQELQKLWIRLK